MAYSPFNKKYFAEKQRLEAEARRKAEINKQMLKAQFDRLTARPGATYTTTSSGTNNAARW